LSGFLGDKSDSLIHLFFDALNINPQINYDESTYPGLRKDQSRIKGCSSLCLESGTKYSVRMTTVPNLDEFAKLR